MGQTGAGLWGTSPSQVGCGHPTCSLSSAGGHFPQTQPGVAGRSGRPVKTGVIWSTGHTRAAGKGVPRGCQGGARGGEGRVRLGLTCYTQVGPCLTLPQFAFLWNGRRWATLETEGPGGRLKPGFAEAATCGWPPAARPWLWLPAPVLATGAPGSQSQRFGLRGWRRAGARPSRGHQASEGGLPYLQVLSPHVHCCKGQLHLLPASILVPLVGDLDEDQEDPGHDAPGHQHEDPCGPRPSASAAGGPGSRPLGSPPGVSTGVRGRGGPPAMFSNVRVAGALLRESHSWYRTHVLSRSSMKPFSWDLGGRGM